jgi:hypothetical protein
VVAFISYSHVDRQLALRVAGTLRRFGLEHWWDDRIPLSKLWNDEIDANLAAASAVLVIWTEASAKSEWVIREAMFAQANDKLVQLRMNGAPLPEGFGALQAAEIPVWEDNTLPRGIRSALNKVAALARRPAVVEEYTRVLGLNISFEKVDAFLSQKKHYEGYFPRLDGALYKDIWEMGTSKTIKLYDELLPGSRSNVDEERYYELIEYLANEDDTEFKKLGKNILDSVGRGGR